MRTLWTLAALAALVLAGLAGATNKQAGKLPTNDQTAFLTTITMEVTATKGKADELNPGWLIPKDQVPNAQHADTAGTADNAKGLEPLSCPAKPAPRSHCYDVVKNVDFTATPPTCTWLQVRNINQCGGNPNL